MTVCEKAYAKINLFLDVTGRREDGFHNIVSLMQSVSLCDEITLTAVRSDKTEIDIRSSDKTLEVNENNLIYKSAAKYLSFFDFSADIKIDLEKRIPIGAGLGGGSSDAAATLRAMNKIFGFATEDQLLRMASEIGSDVSFCLVGGSAVCTGRGEIVTPRKLNIDKDIVISIGNSRVSTPKAYSLLDEKFGDFSRHNEENTPLNPDAPVCYNIFESVINNDEIQKIKEIIAENNASVTLMSGSGPSVFGIFENEYSAKSAKEELIQNGFSAYLCKTV